jgi:hypothetical protein
MPVVPAHIQVHILLQFNAVAEDARLQMADGHLALVGVEQVEPAFAGIEAHGGKADLKAVVVDRVPPVGCVGRRAEGDVTLQRVRVGVPLHIMIHLLIPVRPKRARMVRAGDEDARVGGGGGQDQGEASVKEDAYQPGDEGMLHGAIAFFVYYITGTALR